MIIFHHDTCGLVYVPSRRIKSKSPNKELLAVLCSFRILSVFINVRMKINISNSADASHAAARSEHRTTFFQSLTRRAENVRTYEWHCYV